MISNAEVLGELHKQKKKAEYEKMSQSDRLKVEIIEIKRTLDQVQADLKVQANKLIVISDQAARMLNMVSKLEKGNKE